MAWCCVHIAHTRVSRAVNLTIMRHHAFARTTCIHQSRTSKFHRACTPHSVVMPPRQCYIARQAKTVPVLHNKTPPPGAVHGDLLIPAS
jgi:hypothetical protein